MAPGIEAKNTFSKPPRLSVEGLQRTFSDLSLELSREPVEAKLPPITEVEGAVCECCGMSEECTPEYIRNVRERFCGKWICGLCSEAVKEEMVKKGGEEEEREQALRTHMSACVRFNRIGKTHPALYHAEAMREILKKSSRVRAKSNSPRVRTGVRNGGIARSSSCIPAITREMMASERVGGAPEARLIID